MSVTAVPGFRAAGTSVGIKPTGKKDFAVVINDGPSMNAAVVYTSNKCKANPVKWSQPRTSDGQVRAAIINSGCANCFTGDFGFETTKLTAYAVADAVGCDADDVLVCSTGLIGTGGEDFRSRLVEGVPGLVESASAEGGSDAAEAILTTDSVSKEALAEGTGYTIGAMAKGAGMLAPSLATMIVVITTDAKLSPEQLDRALRSATAKSFDRLDSDGCQSTNDTVALLSSGAGAEADEAEFTALLTEVCTDLARQLMADAEGAAHDVEITVTGAVSEDDAVEVGRAVSRSNLVKTALAGEDPNWGRVLAQVGTADAKFDPESLDVSFNGVQVCRATAPHEDAAKVKFGRTITIEINLNSGQAEATIFTNDLTHEYVTENSSAAS